MSIDNKEIVYGAQDVLPQVRYERKNVKVKISLFVDGDTLLACKEAAKSKGIGYQTLINQKMRELFLENVASSLEARVTALEKLLVKSAHAKTASSKRKAA